MTQAKSKKARPLLDALTARYPETLTPDEVQEAGGKNAAARVEELRRLGWQIATEIDSLSHRAGYRLKSCHPDLPARIQAGVTIRHDSKSGWTARSHKVAMTQGGIPAEALVRAEAAALRAYRDALAGYLAPEDYFPPEDLQDFNIEVFISLGGEE